VFRLEHIPAKACPGLGPGLHDFADKDLLQILTWRESFSAGRFRPAGKRASHPKDIFNRNPDRSNIQTEEDCHVHVRV
jgi:hypothetical protein